jgi:hypothetical protein
MNTNRETRQRPVPSSISLSALIVMLLALSFSATGFLIDSLWVM